MRLKQQRYTVEGNRAAGVTLDAIEQHIANINSDEVDMRSRAYINSRLMPTLIAAYYTALKARWWTYALNIAEYVLPAIATVLGFGASALFRDYAIEALFVVNVINAIVMASKLFEQMDQPALEWANARAVCRSLSKELSLWYGQTNGYQNLDEKEALQLLKRRAEEAMGTAEREIQQQIRKSIEVADDEKSGDLRG